MTTDIFKTIYCDFKNLHNYKSLLLNLLKRDLHLKYRSSIMGYCWSLMNPLIMISVYIIAFKYIMRIRSVDGTNLSSQIIVGITFWSLFSSAVISSASCILNDSELILKVTFPRIISLLRNHLFILNEHFLVYPFLILGLYGWYKVPFTVNILWYVPIFIMFNIFILGISMIIATTTVYYRDVAHFIALGMQILFWLTPIVYPVSIVPQKYLYLFSKAPATPFLLSFYQLFIYGNQPQASDLIMALVYTSIALLFGLFIFYKHQHAFTEKF